MLDLVVKDGRAVGIVARDLITGAVAVALRPRGGARHRRLRQRLLPLHQREGAATSPRSGGRTSGARYMANPCFTQIHPTCIPASDDFQSKLTLMSESLRNDGRIWVPKEFDDARSPDQIPEDERDYFLERRYPAFGNLVPRDVASRAVEARGRRRPRRRPAEERRVPRLRRRDRPARAATSSRSATATSSRCTSASPARTRTRSPCASTPPSTTRWAGSGSTTT